MSFLSSIVIPLLEKELVALEPDIEQFIVAQLKNLGASVVEWAEGKIHANNNKGNKNEAS